MPKTNEKPLATARLRSLSLSKCRVVPKLPKDDKYYDEIYKTSKHYSLEVKPEDCGYYGLYSKIIELLSFSDSILEIGCGTGIFAHLLISQDYNYVLGFDFSVVAVTYSRIRTKSNLFKQINILDFDFNSVQFNTIISLEVFEHIVEDIELINRIPSGKKIIFSVPNFDDVAHVRFFNSIVDVENRYSPLFSEFNIIQFGNIFIINAIK